MMADHTPARETYSRIIGELVSRYPTYWGAVDWLTQIGDDPAKFGRFHISSGYIGDRHMPTYAIRPRGPGDIT